VWHSPIGRLRLVGYVEGTSFLLLLCVAMPLRRFAGVPEAVTVAGWVHGVLFILYVAAVWRAHRGRHLTDRLAGWALLASVLPAGPFVIDHKLKDREKAEKEPPE
jgi:integral membrane protein